MANEKKGEKSRAKRPTAQKREIQNNTRRLINQTFKSRVKTAVRRFKETVAEGDEQQVAEKLRSVYSLMDKGVKRGIFKKNKASRIKSRMALRSNASAAAGE